jgi:hypothetical protein
LFVSSECLVGIKWITGSAVVRRKEQRWVWCSTHWNRVVRVASHLPELFSDEIPPWPES